MSTPAARTTLIASAVTSGPMPSPPITAMRCVMRHDARSGQTHCRQALASTSTRVRGTVARTLRAWPLSETPSPAAPGVDSIDGPWKRTSCPAGLRPAAGRVRRSHHPGPHRGRRQDRARPRARRPQGERRLPRRQGRAGPHGGSHPPARVDPRERRDHRAAGAGRGGPGTIVTIVYDGDSDDMAERYLVGHIEEQTDGADVISPTAPLGAALIGAPHRRLRRRTRRRPAPS